MNDHVTDPQPTEAAASARARSVTTIADDKLMYATAEGVQLGPIAVSDFPVSIHPHILLAGVRGLLNASSDPAALLAKLKGGEITLRKAAAPKERPPQRVAIAQAEAERRCKAEGVKLKSPEGEAILEGAINWAAGLSRSEVAAQMKKTAVLVTYAKLFGES